MTAPEGARGEAREPGVVKRAADAPSNPVIAGAATVVQLLIGPEEGAPNFTMRRFTMDEGGGMPLHSNAVEHEQFVLKGRARVRIGDRVHLVEAGSALYIPAGTPHAYEVVDAPFEFLCVVPNVADRIEVLEEGEPESR